MFKLNATSADGEPLWAYRYRVAGRGSARLQVGGFSTRAEAQRALQNKLARLLPGVWVPKNRIRSSASWFG
ncbi:MAG: SPOR domain-containing protein [Actinobacteria bacterium]|nr:SPOR domain-containing protein [Actinomycetota bacterium]MCA1698229.1 SPOR domain-containing protein [Actinomycetota bacterium]